MSRTKYEFVHFVITAIRYRLPKVYRAVCVCSLCPPHSTVMTYSTLCRHAIRFCSTFASYATERPTSLWCYLSKKSHLTWTHVLCSRIRGDLKIDRLYQPTGFVPSTLPWSSIRHSMELHTTISNRTHCAMPSGCRVSTGVTTDSRPTVTPSCQPVRCAWSAWTRVSTAF